MTTQPLYGSETRIHDGDAGPDTAPVNNTQLSPAAPVQYSEEHSKRGNMGPRPNAGAGWSELNGDDDLDKAADASSNVRPIPSQGTQSSAAKTEGSSSAIELEERERLDDGGSRSSRHASNAAAAPVEIERDDGSGDGVDVAAGPREYKVYKRRWFGLVQLTLLNIIVSWGWLTFTPVAANSAAYYGVDESGINWMTTAFLFAFVAATPATIYMLHKGPKHSIVASAALILVGNWVRYAGSHSKDGGNFGVVMFGQILIGFGQPFVLSAPTRYSDLWFTNRGRVTATALSSLANPFGAALGQLIVPFWVNVPGDVSSAVLYVAIISSVSAIPSFFIPAAPPTPAAPSCETPKRPIRESLRIIFGSLEFWLVFLPFSVYVGFFNSLSSVLNQIMQPWGFSDTDSGIAGAVLIVVGLVTAAATSPVLDRTKRFLLLIKIAVPIIAMSYLAFVWMPQTRSDPGPFVVLAVLGAASFALVPVAVEYLVELTHPVSPEVTSTLGWSGGQLLGGCFILISDALKAGPNANPPYHMTNALIFTAVVALAMVPLPLSLGLFGRGDKVRLRRVKSDQDALQREETRDSAA